MNKLLMDKVNIQKTITTNELRTKFLKYMESKGHAIVPSSPLTPENDPTTLFTGSGMQPMVTYLLGQSHPLGTRIADSQKCFRSQDIEEVGDNRHTTFFEMLGNWSFGDYFKEEQITWMWEFITSNEDECLGLNPENFYVTCFKGNDILGIPRDTYSAELWQKLFKEKGITALINEDPENGIKEGDRIFYYDEKKNWWSQRGEPQKMLEGEPGGPDTEMFYDFDPLIVLTSVDGATLYINKLDIHKKSKYAGEVCHPNCDCGRFMEIGNNVFMQYKKVLADDNKEAKFEELPQMNVDHGSGLERYAAALRNDPDIFNTDVFDGPKKMIEQLSKKTYQLNTETTYAYRVILDHIRAAVFLIGDGVLPGNKDQTYFVRRLVRRAVRFGLNLEINIDFLVYIAGIFIDTYDTDYPNLRGYNRSKILNEIQKEESKFRLTLEKGIKEFEKICSRKFYIKNGEPGERMNLITGEEAFNLLQSYGFPIELTVELANEKGVKVELYDFENYKNEHAEASRTASAGKFKGGLGGLGVMEVKYHTATHLLHEALRQVLGESVEQKGSNITSERLRFDFAFDRKMTEEEKKKVEEIVNKAIAQALPVTREEISYEEARARGAIGLFGDKYGDKVSVYTVGQQTGKRGEVNLFSLEFCGGPHINNTSELGTFKIQKEEAVSAGVRRIKAVLE